VAIIDCHTTSYKGIQMNWDQIEGNWKQLKGNVKQQWGKLTDDQLDVIAGKRDQLAGKIQEVYGTAKNEVEKELTDWQAIQKNTGCCNKETKKHLS
jgi:uncharacterized protein YjbJ (UPF0337 family)